MTLRADFLAFDDELASHGVPPLTAWWREGVGRWLDAYEQDQVLELWACVGRGAAKSTCLYKLAAFFALFGDFVVPPGERHFAIILSRLVEEASKGIKIIDRWLELLGVPHRLAGDVIELVDLPRGIRVVAASVAATSGWRAFFVGKDERGKWPLSGLDERDADEVDTSASAMTATHALAPQPTFGSAWVNVGAFHETIAAGSTAERVVLGPTPTWVAAPHISEADCRRKERDPRKFDREYKSIASDAHDEALYDETLVDRAQRAVAGDVPPEPGVIYLAAMDPALSRNAWTFVIAGLRMVDGRRKASIVFSREWRATAGQKLDPAAVLIAIAGHTRPYGVRTVLTDQWHGESLAAIAERLELGIVVEVDKPTPAEKLARYEGTLTRFHDNALELPRDRVVRADMLAVRRRVTAGVGNFTIHMAVTADGRHADFAPSIVLVLSRIPREVAAAEAYDAKLDRVHAHFVLNGDADNLGLSREVWENVVRGNQGAINAPGVMAAAGKKAAEDDDDRPGLKKRDRIPYNRELLRQGSSILTARDLDELIEAGLITGERKQQYLDDLQVVKGRRSTC